MMVDQGESERLLADVEAYCQELRPIEDLCYLDQRYNTETIDLARKYDLLGMHVPKEFGGRGSDAPGARAARPGRLREDDPRQKAQGA